MSGNADSLCALKPDCPRADPSWPGRLIEKYGARAPRYTSYPTAAQFGPGVGAGHYRRWLAGLDPSRPISLYVHIPFCQSLCWYCGCHTSKAHRRAPVASYLATLEEEIALTAAAIPFRPAIEAVHLGGGSPNSLLPSDIDALFGALNRHFDLGSDTRVAAEIDPRSLTQEWVDAAVRVGLARASLGVQDLDPAVQAAINRHQPYAQVEWAVAALRRAGVRSINLDLVYGLPCQTTAGLLDTIDRVLDLDPDRLALFGYAHVPWMMARQKLIKESELPDAWARYEQQLAAGNRLEDAGYVRIGFDHFAAPADSLAAAQRNGTLRRNFQGYTSDGATTLIGFGASAIGSFDAGFVQNASDVRAWRTEIDAGHLAALRGVELTREDRFWSEIIQRLMCDLRVDLAHVCRKWGVCPAWLAAEAGRLAEMERDGLLRIRGPRIAVTEFGRPFLRAICAVFDQYLGEQPARHSRAI